MRICKCLSAINFSVFYMSLLMHLVVLLLPVLEREVWLLNKNCMIFVKSLFRLFLKNSTLEMLHDNCENTGFLEARVSQTVRHESQREKMLA